jgi:hypothetical protein
VKRRVDQVSIAPNGKASIQIPGPLPFTSYDVIVSCTGTYDGQQVEFGHAESPAVTIRAYAQDSVSDRSDNSQQ